MANLYKSRWGAWVQWCDIIAHPSTFGLIPEFMTSWTAGLAVLESAPVPLTQVHQSCDEVVWGWCLGADVAGYAAGYLGDGTPIGVNPMGAPQAIAALPSHFMDEYVARVTPYAAIQSNKGGHLAGYIGPPNLGYVGAAYDWYKPLTDAGMSDVWYDSGGEITPVLSPELMAVLRDGYARGVRQVLEPWGTQAYEGGLAKYIPYAHGTCTLTDRAALAYATSNYFLQYPNPKATIVLVFGDDRTTVIAASELWLKRGYHVRTQHYTLTADDMVRLTALGRYPGYTYNRPRAALTYSSSTVITLKVTERYGLENAMSGSTGVANIQLLVTQGGTGDTPALLWRIQITPNISAVGVTYYTVIVTPVNGDGSDGPALSATFIHTQDMPVWQDAAGHPQSQS